MLSPTKEKRIRAPKDSVPDKDGETECPAPPSRITFSRGFDGHFGQCLVGLPLVTFNKSS